MTAIRSRRTRSTWVALGASLGALAAVVVMAVAGMRTLANSTAGREVRGDLSGVAIQSFPYTPSALVGVVDDEGRLTSTVVIVVEPDGVGGTIASLAASADAGSGTTGVLEPLNAVYAVRGPTAYLEAVERLTGLSFDVTEVVDRARFVELVQPLGDLPVELPAEVRDDATDESWPAGATELSVPSAARLLTATDPAIADWYYESARAAVWRAVAARVGAGIGSAEPVPDGRTVPTPATLDEVLDRLFAASVAFRAMSFNPIADERVVEQLPLDLVDPFGPATVEGVVAHIRSELLMVFASVAPGRMGAPFDAPIFRVVSRYDDADVEPLGLNRGDVIQRAIDVLLFAKVNVVSVVDAPTEAVPDATLIRVTDPTLVAPIEASYEGLFGTVEVSLADVAIEGIDVEITLGRDYLDVIGRQPAPGVAGSGGDASDQQTGDDGSGSGQGDGAGADGGDGGDG